MAIFHCSVLPISRGKGRSATAAAAYRSGEKIACERTGLTHDYTRKKGINHKEVILPKGIRFSNNRETIWNVIEQVEKRSNSKVAREIRVALPCEISSQKRAELTREFVEKVVGRYNVLADICIHAPGTQGDQRNHHAHILISTRELTPDGFGKKVRIMDDKKQGPEEVKWIRQEWATLTNQYLKQALVKERVDHRSYKNRGIEKTPGTHLGPVTTALERKGFKTERGVLMKDQNELELSKIKPLQQTEKNSSKPVADTNHNGNIDQLNYETLKTKKLNELNLRVKALQNRISQEVADIRDQKEELQIFLKTESKKITRVFNKAPLLEIQKTLKNLARREHTLKIRFSILRAYSDKDRFGNSKLLSRVKNETKIPRYVIRVGDCLAQNSKLSNTDRSKLLSKIPLER